ncbi:hypothetical protein D9M71_407030 [compost metagenome]
MGLLQVRAELEHTEDPQHPYHADDQQVLGVGVVQRNDPRHDRQQVDQAVEAEGVAQRLGRAVQAGEVLGQEDRGKAPFDTGQQAGVALVHLIDAVEDHRDQAGQDDQQQDLVEAATGYGVGLEDDDEEPLAQARWVVHWLVPQKRWAEPRGCVSAVQAAGVALPGLRQVTAQVHQPAGGNEGGGQARHWQQLEQR